MERGDVHLLPLELPNRSTGQPELRNKFVVILRGGPSVATETDVPFVVASTDRRAPGQTPRRFEVSVGPAEGFEHATIIDCRWVYTQLKARFSEESFRFPLPPATMGLVSVALVAGLQMHP